MNRNSQSDVDRQSHGSDELLFRRAADSSVDGVVILDLDRRIIYVNEARARMHGYTPDELIGRNIVDISAGGAAATISRRVLEDGQWSGEAEGLKKDGATFPIRQSISRVDDENGKPIAMLSVTRDITQERLDQQSLERRTRQLAALLEASREINSALDTSTVMRLLVKYGMSLISASAGTAGLFVDGEMVFKEYNNRGELIPVDLTFMPGHGVPGWVVKNQSPYLTNDAEDDPNVLAHIQRKLGFHRLVNVPIISSEGQLLGCFELHNFKDEPEFTNEDVELLTGLANQAAVALQNAAMAEVLREWAETVKKSEEALRLVVEGSPDFFFYVSDAKGVFTYVSPSVETATGYTVEEWAAHYSRFLTDNPINDEVVRVTEMTLKDGTVANVYPVEIHRKDGSRMTVEVYERPIIEQGKVIGIRGVARDVTELRRIEAAERRLREESEQRMSSFYRDTILSVTDGKLVICDPDEIATVCDSPLFPPMEICEAKDVGLARAEVRQAARIAGMDESQIDGLVLCVGEAATNAVKHADGGILCVGDGSDSILVKISDSGPGMDSLALPKLTLMRGFSSTRSLGMGYAAILAEAQTVYLCTNPSGTTVVVEMPKQPQPSTIQLSCLPDLW